jgi:pyrroloquinoline-quinone synthase
MTETPSHGTGSSCTNERRPPLANDAFVEWMREEGTSRYHHRHPFNLRMHEGRLTARELSVWVQNRYYYQTRIPLKDALILSKSEDSAFRRTWIHRIEDHDGCDATNGGLGLWHRLGEALGVPRDELVSLRGVLPGVRFACDAYVEFVRSSTLLEAVASSLTELFAPDLMATRIEAFVRYYPFVDQKALEYFRSRVPRARRDSEEAMKYVVSHATTYEAQASCVRALIRKTEILWHLLDCVSWATAERGA